jgi:hypothetical protein
VTNTVRATKDFNLASLDTVTAQQGAADKLTATNLLIGQQGITLDHTKTTLHDVVDQYNQGQSSLQNVAKALNDVNVAQKAIDATWAAEPPIVAATKDLSVSAYAAALGLAGLVTQAQFLPGPLGQSYEILDRMHVKMGEQSRDIEQLGRDYVQLGTVTHTVDEMDAAWVKVSGSLNKIAATDLPLAIKMENTHIAAMQAAGAAQGALYAEEEKALQLEITSAEQRGEDANAQVVQLNNIKLLQQALTDQSDLWGKTQVKATNDAIAAFVNMGQGIAQVIVEGGNMGKVFIDTAKKIAEAILTDIIKAGLQAIVDMIVKSVVPAIASQVAPVVGTTAAIKAMAVAMEVATVSMSRDIQSLIAQFNELSASIGGATGSEGGAGAGGAGGGAGATGGTGGTMTTIGAISSAVNAISSIFGNFQMQRMISTLGQIEENTRRMDIVFEKYAQSDEWDRYNGILAKWDDQYTRLGDIWNEIRTGWENIVSALSVAGTLPAGGVPPSVAPPIGTPPSDAPPSGAPVVSPGPLSPGNVQAAYSMVTLPSGVSQAALGSPAVTHHCPVPGCSQGKRLSILRSTQRAIRARRPANWQTRCGRCRASSAPTDNRI